MARSSPAQKRIRQTGVLVLHDNLWSDCSIDGLRGDWSRLSAEPPRGFSEVTAGRHHIVATHEGEPITLDLVLYPGEILVRRFDPLLREFILEKPDVEQKAVLLASRGGKGSPKGSFVDYTRVAATVKGSAPALLPDEIGLRVAAAFVSAAEEVVRGADHDVLMERTYRAGLELVGHVMLSPHIQRLVGLVSMTASPHAMQGDYELAAHITLLGLSILPGEPWLLDLLANLYADQGMPLSALPLSEEATRRAHILPDKLGRQLRTTYAEIVATLKRGL